MNKAIPEWSDQKAVAELQARGFCVIREFLDKKQTDQVYEDYQNHGASKNQNYSIGLASDDIIALLETKISSLAQAISKATDIDTDYAGLHQAYYFDATVLNFNSWHQDAESFYMLQNHANYLNFYMPVFKPVLEKTNVQVIPWDSLVQKTPAEARKLSGQGGTICVRGADHRTLIFGEQGEIANLDFDINDLAETPALGVGDLLLLRGDTFHRTQDVETPRVALSLRLSSSSLAIRHDELAKGTTRKINLMANNWTEFGPIFDRFDETGADEISWGEVRGLIQQSIKTGGDKTTPRQAKLKMLRHKLKTGVLIETVGRELKYRQALHRMEHMAKV